MESWNTDGQKNNQTTCAMSYSHSSELLYIHVCVYCRSCLSYSIYNLYQFVVWVEYDWTGSIHFPATRHPSRHPSCLQSLSVSPMTTGLEAHLPVGFHSRSSKPALAVCDSVRLLKSKKNFVDFLKPPQKPHDLHAKNQVQRLQDMAGFTISPPTNYCHLCGGSVQTTGGSGGK